MSEYIPQIAVDGNWSLEYYRNRSIRNGSNDFTRAVIVIHGMDRDADDSFLYVRVGLWDLPNFGNILRVAPRFQTLEDAPLLKEDGTALSRSEKNALTAEQKKEKRKKYFKDNKLLYWSEEGWKKGYRSKNGGNESSFSAIDELLDIIHVNYPKIKLVTICGHSAGGQFVQRYAALNQKDNGKLRFAIRYVVANPSSYMYLSSDRPKSKDGCSSYDNYKYGISDVLDDLYFTKGLTKEKIKAQLLSRPVHVLLGVEDNQSDDQLDTNCQANAQGANRFERGTLYLEHIQELKKDSNHFFSRIEGVGHSSRRMFGSKEAEDALSADIFVNGNGRGNPIPSSGTSGEAEFTVEVKETGKVASVVVRLDCDHSYARDLQISLKSPAGTNVLLADQKGGGGANFYRHTIFDDKGCEHLQVSPGPFTGRFRPEAKLSAFVGESTKGIWKLKIKDMSSSDFGKMNTWSLVIRLQ